MAKGKKKKKEKKSDCAKTFSPIPCSSVMDSARSGKFQVPLGNRCKECPAACCRSLLVDYSPSENLTLDELDYMRYALMREHVGFHFDGEEWFMAVDIPCPHIVVVDGQHRCAIYEQRPGICREHSPQSCSEKVSLLYGDDDGFTNLVTVADLIKWKNENGYAQYKFPEEM